MAASGEALTRLEAAVSGLLAALQSARGDRDALKERVSELERELTAAQRALAGAGDKKVVFAQMESDRMEIRQRVRHLVSELDAVLAADQG